MPVLGLPALYPKPCTGAATQDQKSDPYVLYAVGLRGPHQVWSADRTDVRWAKGFMSLVAIIAWWSRSVLEGRWPSRWLPPAV
jgi:hypothetical protein